jgi:antitoxin component of MazEF toxin-antitoxin module
VTKIERIGKDLVIRIPREIARQVGFRAGMKMEIDIFVDQLNIRREGAPRRRSKYRFADLFKKWKGPSPHRGVYDDRPVGRELI